MAKFPSNFRNLVGNHAGTLNYEQYNSASLELREAYDRVTARPLVVAIVLYGLTLWAIAEQVYFLAAFCFLLGNGFDRKSNASAMMSDVVVSNRYLAMLINQQAKSGQDHSESSQLQ